MPSFKLPVQALALLLTSSVFAQQKDYPGYYITSGGDSVRGTFPSYVHWENNPDRVAFRTLSGSTVQLTPVNCRIFSVEGYETYAAFSGLRMTNPATSERALEEYKEAKVYNPPYGENKYAPVTTFLRQFAQWGPYRFYELKDALRTNLYYRAEGGPFEELLYKAFMGTERDRQPNAAREFVANMSLMEVHRFRQQLANLLRNEAPLRKLEAHVSRLDYSDDAIAQLLRRLFPDQASFQSRTRDSRNGLIALGGVSLNRFHTTGTGAAAAYTTYPSAVVPVFGAAYLHHSKRNFGRIVIFPQVKLSFYKAQGETVYNNYPYTTTFRSKFVLQTTFSMGYNIVNKGPVNWFVAPGLGVLVLPDNLETSRQRTNNNRENVQEHAGAEITFLPSLATGVTLGGHAFFWANYNAPASMTQSKNFKALLQSMQLGVGFKF